MLAGSVGSGSASSSRAMAMGRGRRQLAQQKRQRFCSTNAVRCEEQPARAGSIILGRLHALAVQLMLRRDEEPTLGEIGRSIDEQSQQEHADAARARIQANQPTRQMVEALAPVKFVSFSEVRRHADFEDEKKEDPALLQRAKSSPVLTGDREEKGGGGGQRVRFLSFHSGAV